MIENVGVINVNSHGKSKDNFKSDDQECEPSDERIIRRPSSDQSTSKADSLTEDSSTIATKTDVDTREQTPRIRKRRMARKPKKGVVQLKFCIYFFLLLN